MIRCGTIPHPGVNLARARWETGDRRQETGMNLASSLHGCRPRSARLPSKNRKLKTMPNQDQTQLCFPTTDRTRGTVDTVHQTPTIRTMPTTRKRPGTPTAGMRIRQYWAPLVAAGQVTCDRCWQPIRPGDSWQLGHPIDAPYAAGNHDWNTCHPQHQLCNQSGIVRPKPQETFGW